MDIFEGLDDNRRGRCPTSKGALLVRAPVATGKTTVIARRVAHAVENGVAPAAMLCLSFTNRTAREVRDRVSLFLGETVADIHVSTFHSLCAHILRCESDLVGIQADFSINDGRTPGGCCARCGLPSAYGFRGRTTIASTPPPQLRPGRQARPPFFG